jgi:poly(3-hydroxybutyrate) depolymerase
MASPPEWPPWLWPVSASLKAGQAALRTWGELLDEFGGTDNEPPVSGPEPSWTTGHKVVLDLPTMQLRDFSTARGTGIPTLLIAPYALHGAVIADLAPGHSLIEALRGAGVSKLFLTDWKSAAPGMRFFSIDTYLAELNVAVDEVGGKANLLGLCQGGWLSLMFSARFPSKVRCLVLAGSPIDLEAERSNIVEAARAAQPEVFEELVRLGGERILGHRMLGFWGVTELDPAAIGEILQIADVPEHLCERFRAWHRSPLDLPGSYYLQVVEQLFRGNHLAKGEFQALGRSIDLSKVTVPLFLLAGRDDEVTSPGQLLAAARLVGTSPRHTETAVAGCGHLSLFLGARTLTSEWARMGAWLAEADRLR